MNKQQLQGHKKILGILYIVSSLLTIVGMLVLNTVIALIFGLVLGRIDPEEKHIMDIILPFLSYLPTIVIVFIATPTFIAGVGLVTHKRWALLLSLIIGCLKLFSFPIGTAIGVYAIWIFSEDQKLSQHTN